MIRFETFIANETFNLEVYDELEELFTTYTFTSNNRGVVLANFNIPIGFYTCYLIDINNDIIATSNIYSNGTELTDAATQNMLNTKIEAEYSLKDLTLLSAVALLGKSRQDGTLTIFTSLDNATDRIIATTTTEGDRTSVSLIK